MAEITLSPQRRAALLEKISNYMDQELERPVGQFEAEFLLDFISRELGPSYYNQGLQDAQAVVRQRIELVLEDIEAQEVYPD
ncbi:DUF2164 domain-containing protein [Aliagarivorans marinus]|uniref:DUF2164 domain-containing protein n=1 Tax=Aliagarivorans marinus TaxID=561965 RepID=UPI00040629C8|nr:DUF2164 domain-containing protein [Aliagarivorans marinus]